MVKKLLLFYKSSIVLLLSLLLLPLAVQSQEDNLNTQKSVDHVVMEWMEDLYVAGVSMTDDSIFISEESLRLINDAQYRQEVYPETYTWETALKLISKQELKKAFWYMINLSMINEKNKDLVVKSILTYDKFLEMDKVLTNSFYTYCFTDPEIGHFNDGKPEITAPHILDKKLEAVKEILFYVEKYKDHHD